MKMILLSDQTPEPGVQVIARKYSKTINYIYFESDFLTWGGDVTKNGDPNLLHWVSGSDFDDVTHWMYESDFIDLVM